MKTRMETQPGNQKHRRGGFTLVEILIVVVILGILAAMVIPQFSSAMISSQDSAIQMDLYRIRKQIEIYNNQHKGNYPALNTIVEQLSLPTDADGNVGARNMAGTPAFPYGPYIVQWPRNPRVNSETIVGFGGSYGDYHWSYDQSTGRLRAFDSETSFAW